VRVVVSVEHRFDRGPDGSVWTQVQFAYNFFWAHYLSAFDEVCVVARVRDVDTVSPTWLRADGPHVTFVPVPFYLGPLQYVRRYREIAHTLGAAVGPRDAVICRVPSQIATQMLSYLPPGRPFALQVVGDPYDVLAPGAMSHPLRPFFRWWYSRQMRSQCGRAAAASYVTREALQRRYPCPGYTVSFSDVQIPGSALADVPRPPRAGAGPFVLVTVGSLEHHHKAVDVQIDAVAECVRRGLDLRLLVIGQGRLRGELEGRARSLGLDGRVEFLGQLTAGEAVRAELDKADLFLLPSRTEGLPRAMIEAMARGLPCVGSTAGGIPELLAPEDLVPPGDAPALAGKIAEVVRDPARLSAMSARNLAVADDFRESILRERRAGFYLRVRQETERWLNGRAVS
jgi:glycosyltransferase involved in cell wall biosynthesis